MGRNVVVVSGARGPGVFARVKALGGKAVAAASVFAMTTGAALAQEAGDVESIIGTQKALALAVVVAGTVAILAIKYSKLARRA